MANAAAKKAAAARGAAAATYFPLVLALNLGYLGLRLVYRWDSLTLYHCAAAAALVGLSHVSYKGILEDHARPCKSGDQTDALAGGASLDLLGLTTLVQYGTVLLSERCYWALAALPLWGGWKLYGLFGAQLLSWFLPKKSGDGAEEAPADAAAEEKARAKRQKRSERRRQKWD